jgi:hypothetical protein
VKRRPPLCHKLLQDARLYELLLKFDEDLAAKVRAAGCKCGGRLDAGNYQRKPRGGPSNLGERYDLRFSFCCAVDGCRARRMPSSVRFLGPKVFFGAVVVLATAMQQGPTRQRVSRLGELLGVSRRTLARWRHWWAATFRTSRFWQSLRNRFMPAVDERTLPLVLLERLTCGDDGAGLAALLRLLLPISTTPGLEARAS